MKNETMIIFAAGIQMMTYKELELKVVGAIAGLYGHTEARSVQRYLFSCYSDLEAAQYLLLRNDQADKKFEDKVMKAIPLLIEFVPVQYITGITWFCGYRFHVRPGVLIPRPETEGLVMKIAQKHQASKGIRILDIGTGSGAIAISLALELNEAKVEAIDISGVALGIAKENAEANRAMISFNQIDILDQNGRDKLPSYRLIVSNPPYVRQSERSRMRRNVLDYEPGTALFVEDSDPLLYYRAIACFAQTHLETNGELWFEINESEGENLALLLNTMGFSQVEVFPDQNQRPRYVFAFR